MLVTYIPRLLPFYMINAEKIPHSARVYLSFVPYAILGALIFPGILNAIPENTIGSIITGIVCFACAAIFNGTLIPLAAGITAAFFIQLLCA